MSYRRLPDGTNTDNEGEYLDAWHRFAAVAETLFRGYKLSSFDPDIVLTDYTTWHTVRLNIPAVEALALGVAQLRDRQR